MNGTTGLALGPEPRRLGPSHGQLMAGATQRPTMTVERQRRSFVYSSAKRFGRISVAREQCLFRRNRNNAIFSARRTIDAFPMTSENRTSRQKNQRLYCNRFQFPSFLTAESFRRATATPISIIIQPIRGLKKVDRRRPHCFE